LTACAIAASSALVLDKLSATLLLTLCGFSSFCRQLPLSSLGVPWVPYPSGGFSLSLCMSARERVPGATVPPLPSSLSLPSSGAVSAIHWLSPCTFPCRSIGRLEALAGISSGSELRGLGMDPKTFRVYVLRLACWPPVRLFRLLPVCQFHPSDQLPVLLQGSCLFCTYVTLSARSPTSDPPSRCRLLTSSVCAVLQLPEERLGSGLLPVLCRSRVPLNISHKTGLL